MNKTLLFIILPLSILLIGCFATKPDLSKNEWVSLDVKYCVGSNETFSVKSWKTSDANILKELRNAYHQTAIRSLSVAGYTKSNRVIVTTQENGSWYLFLYASTSARLRKVGSPKRSYSVDLSPTFYNYLLAKLISLEDNPIIMSGRICNIWEKGITPR